jgi:hypothetical protein
MKKNNFLQDATLIGSALFVGILILAGVGFISNVDKSDPVMFFSPAQQMTISSFLEDLKIDATGYKIVLPDNANNELISAASSFASGFGISESIFEFELGANDNSLIILQEGNCESLIPPKLILGGDPSIIRLNYSLDYISLNLCADNLNILREMLQDLEYSGNQMYYDFDYVNYMGGGIVKPIINIDDFVSDFDFSFLYYGLTMWNQHGQIDFLTYVYISSDMTGKYLSEMVTINETNINVDISGQTLNNPGFNVPARLTFYDTNLTGYEGQINLYDNKGNLMDVDFINYAPLIIEASSFESFDCTDNDGDMYAIEGGDCGMVDCNDNNYAINPSKTEICNGLNDDCDNSTLDTDLIISESCGIGICTGGNRIKTCDGTSLSGWSSCSTDGLALSQEICNNGLDDDCNGEVDEGDHCHACYGESVPVDTDGNGYLEIVNCCDLWLIKDSNIGSEGAPVKYELKNNIDCSDTVNWDKGKGFEPIGDGRIVYTNRGNTMGLANAFYGTFDGKGFNIENLYINRPNENNIGLFSGIGKSTTIKNLDLVNANITGRENTGAFIGSGKGTSINVIDCSVTGSINGGKNTGGLIGIIGSYVVGLASPRVHIEKSYSEANVKGYTNTGGLVGRHRDVISFKNCYSTGNVIGTGTGTGGLIGWTSSCFYCSVNIINSYTTGNISGIVSGAEGKYVSGISGIGGYLYISNSFSIGSVSGGYSTVAFTNAKSSVNNYFNNHTGNPDNSGTNAIAINDDENYFKDSSNPPMNSWDFDNIWAIDPNINEGYPYLK